MTNLQILKWILMTFLSMSNQIHYETGTDVSSGSVLANEMELSADQLASEKGADQNREGYELPSQSGEHAEGYHKGDWQMDRKKPLCRKFRLIRSPISEGKVKNKNKCCYR